MSSLPFAEAKLLQYHVQQTKRESRNLNKEQSAFCRSKIAAIGLSGLSRINILWL